MLVNVESVMYSTRCRNRLASEIEMNNRGRDFHLPEFSLLDELNIIIKDLKKEAKQNKTNLEKNSQRRSLFLIF